MTKKNSRAKAEKLTLKQKKLVEALPVTHSIAQAGGIAGYSDRTAASRALKSIAERAPEVLERLGLSIEFVVDNCLRPLLTAKETKFFSDKGIVMETRDVEANDIRLRAIEVWARLMGAYAARESNDGNGERSQSGGPSLSVVFTEEGSAREFVEAIAARRSAGGLARVDAGVDAQLG